MGEIVRALRNTSCPEYFKMIKRILIKHFYRRRFPKKAIQAAKDIQFGMRNDYLEAPKRRSLVSPIPIRTKFYNYLPSVGIIFRMAWLRVRDDAVLSQLFPTAPFPVWCNHPNLKNILSYKHKNFSGEHDDRDCVAFQFLKFNRPLAKKRSNTM